MKICLINGNAQDKSTTRSLVKTVQFMLEKQQIETLFFDVGIHELPIFKEGNNEHAGVKKLRSCASLADGFFICTPDYHNGMSGALKNALDYLGKPYFKGKPAAIAATAGGGKGGINALNNLRIVLRGMHAFTLPEQMVIDNQYFDNELKLTDEKIIRQLDDLIEQFIHTAKRFL
ncbi:azobenzene reductase [Scopulibacillus daqui]|uniref:Azobenzene reductase n=2 Tax=Scopulibacillus daqui TaxID=1469162 RepID=A0ABS2Q2I6_9BACL|nr:NADPH-dependent FMN reductase [Scopulibacillus daqui]MBM7646165.1 azobenzene reductase [Scopulibacillus daqui]